MWYVPFWKIHEPPGPEEKMTLANPVWYVICALLFNDIFCAVTSFNMALFAIETKPFGA